MSIAGHSWDFADRAPLVTGETQNWYALLTRARHERIVAHRLRENNVTTFVPMVTEIRRWSDRKKLVELPLFSCYLFAKLSPTNEGRLKALRTDGVVSIVGNRTQGTPIPEEQIETVRRVVEERLPWHAYPFLKIGQRVRIRSGAFDGIEGILVDRNGESTLVISIDAIQRSLAVRVEGYEVEAA